MSSRSVDSSESTDAQVVELLGRNRLVDELLRAGLEVAFPVRDRGIDLIAYADKGDGISEFAARPIQMKAASSQSFGIAQKYTAFPNLILAFVWNVADRDKAATYALTHQDAIGVADEMGYTNTDSWQLHGGYGCTKVGKRLQEVLHPHRMDAGRWRKLIIGNGH